MKLILLLTILLSFGAKAAQTSSYISAQAGYFSLSQDAASEHNVSPTGTSYGVGLGYRLNYIEFEATMLSASATGDLEHDSLKNSLEHSQTSLIFGFNFYLNKALYLRLGYGFHKIEQKFGKQMSDVSAEGAKDEYGIVEDELSEGMVVGGGVTFYSTNTLDCFLQVDRYNYSSINSAAWNGSLGIRYHL